MPAKPLLFGLDPKCVDQAGEVAKQGQNNVEDKRPADPFIQQYTQRGQDDGKYNSPKAHNNASFCFIRHQYITYP
ncbi:hypothetical protein D3C81_1895360 [compost metagenome]